MLALHGDAVAPSGSCWPSCSSRCRSACASSRCCSNSTVSQEAASSLATLHHLPARHPSSLVPAIGSAHVRPRGGRVRCSGSDLRNIPFDTQVASVFIFKQTVRQPDGRGVRVGRPPGPLARGPRRAAVRGEVAVERGGERMKHAPLDGLSHRAGAPVPVGFTFYKRSSPGRRRCGEHHHARRDPRLLAHPSGHGHRRPAERRPGVLRPSCWFAERPGSASSRR